MTGLTKRFALLTLCAAVIAVTTVTISGCGGDNNPGGDNRFAMFSLTTAVYPENSGTLSRDPNANTYQNGTEVVLTATPAAGFRFAGWSDTSILQVTPLTITMTRNVSITVDGDKELTANFILNEYRLTTGASPVGGGTVTRNPNLESYAPGTRVRLTATPTEGYVFARWTDPAIPATPTAPSGPPATTATGGAPRRAAQVTLGTGSCTGTSATWTGAPTTRRPRFPYVALGTCARKAR